MHYVLLLGTDDDARRALHVMLDRIGKHVAAVTELDAGRSYLRKDPECDAVLATGALAAQLARGGRAPPVIAVVRPRDVTSSIDELALEKTHQRRDRRCAARSYAPLPCSLTQFGWMAQFAITCASLGSVI